MAVRDRVCVRSQAFEVTSDVAAVSNFVLLTVARDAGVTSMTTEIGKPFFYPSAPIGWRGIGTPAIVFCCYAQASAKVAD